MNLSLSELQKMAAEQQEQIEHNKQILISREEHLRYLKEQQTVQENLHNKHSKQRIEHEEIKRLRLTALQSQINQEKNFNSTYG